MWTAIYLGFHHCGCFLPLHSLHKQYFGMGSRRFKRVTSFSIFTQKYVNMKVPRHQYLSRTLSPGFYAQLSMVTKLHGISHTVISAGPGVGGQGTMGNCIGLSVMNTGHLWVHPSFGRAATFHILSTELGRTLSKKWKNKHET